MNVVIIGGGQVGAYIANLLLANNCTVKVIENRENVFAKLKNDLPLDVIIRGNGTDPNVLEAAGIAQADVVAAVTGADETNLVASTISKFEFGVPRVVARVNNPKNVWLFNAGMGVDVGLNQADLMAHLVIEEMNFKNMLTLMKMSRGNYSIVQIQVDAHSSAVHKQVGALSIPQNSVLIAIYRDQELIIPHGETVILGGDTILAFADDTAQSILNEHFGPAM